MIKGVLKGFALALGVSVVLGLLAWGGTLVYWHLRIRSAVRVLEEGQPSPMKDQAFTELRRAGCRSLPYLVQALDPDGNDIEIPYVLTRVFDESSAGAGPSARWIEPSEDGILYTMRALSTGGGSPELRRTRVERIRRWWKETGTTHHQWWRVWSDSCGSARW